jgi:hypothetical protein
MGGFALDTVGAYPEYPEFLPEVRMTLNQVAFGRLLDLLLDETVPKPPPSQNTTKGSKGPDNRHSSSEQHLPQEQESEFQSQQIKEAGSASAEKPQDEEHTEDKFKADVNTVSKEYSETSNYNLYGPLNISGKDLEDKSKASSLAKGLVCLQALWFSVQCLARVAQGFPVTLLELNKFAHSTCALVVYILWWDKPLDVEQPTCLPIHGANAIRKWSEINNYTFRRNYTRVYRSTGPIWEPKRRIPMPRANRRSNGVVHLKTLRPTGKVPKGVPR